MRHISKFLLPFHPHREHQFYSKRELNHLLESDILDEEIADEAVAKVLARVKARHA